MQEFDTVNAQEFNWVKSSAGKRRYELRAGEAVVATLSWTRGRQAEAEWSKSRYRFSRQGWFRQRTLVFELPQAAPKPAVPEQSVAILVHQGSGGTLIFSNGRTFRWSKAGTWSNQQVWLDSHGGEVIRFAPGHRDATVVLHPATDLASIPELPLLLLLGQYLLVSAAEEAEAATTAALVAVIASS